VKQRIYVVFYGDFTGGEVLHCDKQPKGKFVGPFSTLRAANFVATFGCTTELVKAIEALGRRHKRVSVRPNHPRQGW
jgi:hypothetical protein